MRKLAIEHLEERIAPSSTGSVPAGTQPQPEGGGGGGGGNPGNNNPGQNNTNLPGDQPG